jgi:hypothetical protein
LSATFDFVVFVIVIDPDLNFRYNYCLPMKRNIVT